MAKTTWANGETFAHTDMNSLATEVNAKATTAALATTQGEIDALEAAVYTEAIATNPDRYARRDLDVRAATSTAVSVTIDDRNRLITLSNAAAITVTLPTATGVPFLVGAQIHFLWLGVGKPTFAAATGATVNATPTLGMRARYSMATAIKIATNGWVVVGDMSAT